MWNTNTYWTFSNALDEKTCNKIIDIGNNAEWGGGEVETNSKFEVDEAVRKSGVVFTNEQWYMILYGLIWKRQILIQVGDIILNMLSLCK